MLKAHPFSGLDAVCHSFSDFSNADTCVETKGGFALLLGLYRHLRPLLQPNYAGRALKRRPGAPPADAEKKGSVRRALESAAKDLLHSFTGLSPAANRALVERFILRALARRGHRMEKVEFYDHHLCHAAAGYHFSPFPAGEKALSLTLDGQGDGYFSKCYLFEGAERKLLGASRSERFRHKGRSYAASLGEVYGNFTEALGYARNSDEGKTEALAAFGTPDGELLAALKAALKISGGEMSFDLGKLRPFYDRNYLEAQLARAGRENFSAAVQKFLEDAVVEYLNGLPVPADVDRLCLSGGVSANIIMNLHIFERTRFKNIYVFPAMSDCGTAAGAAVLCALERGADLAWLKEKPMPYYGESYSREQVKAALAQYAALLDHEDLGENFAAEAARAVAAGRVVALFQGRMEFGPRALGNRSILADPRSPGTRDKLNSKVKRRPAFQPFCPSLLESERERLFERSFPHKHMALAFRMKKEFQAALPAVIHADGTARPQCVEPADNPVLYEILSELKRLTGYGVCLNTSFNLHGRAMVRTPQDAVTDFLDCGLDELYIEGYRVRRKP